MNAQRLEGGNSGGAVRIGDTTRRPAGPWTPAVHALLNHLNSKSFPAVPRPLGIDDQKREILTFVHGETVGNRSPWPAWVYSDDTLDQVARWLRSYHEAVADFVPPADAVWRLGQRWRPGLIIGHNDSVAYNAVWRGSSLVGFIDWDFAGPVSVTGDLAWVAFGWVPLHAKSVVAAEGFTDFAARPRRLARFLEQYGWAGNPQSFLETVRARVRQHASHIRELAAAGDPLSTRLVEGESTASLERAIAELDDIAF